MLHRGMKDPEQELADLLARREAVKATIAEKTKRLREVDARRPGRCSPSTSNCGSRAVQEQGAAARAPLLWFVRTLESE